MTQYNRNFVLPKIILFKSLINWLQMSRWHVHNLCRTNDITQCDHITKYSFKSVLGFEYHAVINSETTWKKITPLFVVLVRSVLMLRLSTLQNVAITSTLLARESEINAHCITVLLVFREYWIIYVRWVIFVSNDHRSNSDAKRGLR